MNSTAEKLHLQVQNRSSGAIFRPKFGQILGCCNHSHSAGCCTKQWLQLQLRGSMVCSHHDAVPCKSRQWPLAGLCKFMLTWCTLFIPIDQPAHRHLNSFSDSCRAGVPWQDEYTLAQWSRARFTVWPATAPALRDRSWQLMDVLLHFLSSSHGSSSPSLSLSMTSFFEEVGRGSRRPSLVCRCAATGINPVTIASVRAGNLDHMALLLGEVRVTASRRTPTRDSHSFPGLLASALPQAGPPGKSINLKFVPQAHAGVLGQQPCAACSCRRKRKVDG
jgi:hypothetical protein